MVSMTAQTSRPRTRRIVVGLVTAAVAVGVGHLVAAIIEPATAPLAVVGQAAIDMTPEWLKSFAIRTFGEDDKTVLLIGMALIVTIGAAVLGIVAAKRPRRAFIGLLVLGTIGAAAALTRPGASPIDALPSIVGALAGAFAFSRLHAASGGAPRAPADGETSGEPAPGEVPAASGLLDRRRFVRATMGGAAVAVTAGALGTFLGQRTDADDSRLAANIPEPTSPAGEVTGAGLDVAETQPFFTPNDRFYRVDTTFVTPSLMADEWSLRVHGMVEREITLTYDELLARPLIERDVTLACVSNEVGGKYIGNARWIGAQLAPLLEEAGIDPASDQLFSRSVDGWTCGTPTSVVMDGRDAMLAVAMNGEPLPIAHGFPVRMVVPGLYGYVSATKWVVEIEATTFEREAYWVRRGWAQEAPIKTQSRIDTPRAGASLPAGEVAVAGIAWAQHVGIDAVEVQVDDGPWAAAELAAEDTPDTWRLWVYRWQAGPGDHTLTVRATDRSAATQTEVHAAPFPDGATGHHTIDVRVA